ncbi:GHMP kinase [candidate division KSB1 bacterium]|nr:GHMP kinase [candidate division KSB1 bacterium]
MIRTRAYARAGLAGNPSDGYYGKTLSVTLFNFYAQVDLYGSKELEIMSGRSDAFRYSDPPGLALDVHEHGYCEPIRLIQAAIVVFWRYSRENAIALDRKNFSLSWNSTIPMQVGLAGSSAIITAVMRALMHYYSVKIEKAILANLVLEAETKELGIAAGLQDRVVQAYEGLVFMNFDHRLMKTRGFGYYESLDRSILPPLYIAYSAASAELSGVPHSDLRQRYLDGDEQVLNAMQVFAQCAQEARDALIEGKPEKLAAIMNRNFDQRRAVMPISSLNQALIDSARSTGASAKFTGSGGAIVGTFSDEKMLGHLQRALELLPATVIKAQLYPVDEKHGETVALVER